MDNYHKKYSEKDRVAFAEIEQALRLLSSGWEPIWAELQGSLPVECSSYVHLVPYVVDRVMSQLDGMDEEDVPWEDSILVPPWEEGPGCQSDVSVVLDVGHPGVAEGIEPLSQALGKEEAYVSASFLIKRKHRPCISVDIGVVRASRIIKRCSPLATIHPLPPVGCDGLNVVVDYNGGGIRAYIPYKVAYSKERLLRHKFKRNSSRRRDIHQGVQIVHDGKKAQFFGSSTCQNPVAETTSHTVQSLGRWRGEGASRDTKIVLADNVKGAVIQMPEDWSLPRYLLQWCRAERLSTKWVVTCYYTGHKRDFPLKGWEEGFAQHLLFLHDFVTKTRGLGIFHIYCLRGAEQLARTLRLTDPIRRQVFIDHEGSRSSELWGHAIMETNMYEGVIHFWTNTECTLPRGSFAYAKGKHHEESLIGDKIVVNEIDYLIPWEREKKYSHSPLGGVLQMAVRVFGMQCGALHLDFRYEESISQWCQQSREKCGMSFVIAGSDVISMVRIAHVSGVLRGPESLRKYEYSFFGDKKDRRTFFEGED